MARVAVDCRYLGNSGIGRHLEGILDYLDYDKDEFLFIGKRDVLDKCCHPVSKIYCESNPFSFKGLTDFPSDIVNSFDYFYTPNFIIPIGVKTKILSTIHDVVFFEFKECCNGFIDKAIKKAMIKRAIRKSEKIFTVSGFSKRRILKFFPQCSDIKVIFNGISKQFQDFDLSDCSKKDYIIYVGNIKKHKGLQTLLDAYDAVRKKGQQINLCVLGTKENFRTSDEYIARKIAESDINFLGYKSGAELMRIIAEAKILIQPSLYEGFGLPPLEALYLGTKPIISDIEVFKEIYDGLDVDFFKCGDALDLSDKIMNANPKVCFDKKDLPTKFDFHTVAAKVQEEFI